MWGKPSSDQLALGGTGFGPSSGMSPLQRCSGSWGWGRKVSTCHTKMPLNMSEKQRIGRACIELKNIQLCRQTLLILFNTDIFTVFIGIIIRLVHTNVPGLKRMVTPKGEKPGMNEIDVTIWRSPKMDPQSSMVFHVKRIYHPFEWDLHGIFH